MAFEGRVRCCRAPSACPGKCHRAVIAVVIRREQRQLRRPDRSRAIVQGGGKGRPLRPKGAVFPGKIRIGIRLPAQKGILAARKPSSYPNNNKFVAFYALYCIKTQYYISGDNVLSGNNLFLEQLMPIDRKQVTIHYRKFTRDGTYPNRTLEAMIRAAMQSTSGGTRLRDSYALRVQPAGDDHFFVNTYADQANDGTPLVFGDVIHFTKGHLQALFRVGDASAPFAAVQQMPAPALSEYVHSQMFWMVKGDQVFVIQSISLKTEQWEN